MKQYPEEFDAVIDIFGSTEMRDFINSMPHSKKLFHNRAWL
ncbi:MAG: hypothetical protein Rpha_1523 [Candidatus Ruthia sp. Apha_13_S6]|nr:hypothetical protein [Candidatus Ruthia sp. Apha_13_S6]